MAGYRHLLDQGFDPARIVVGGDSAGGGLAIALLLAAREAGLPLPAAALCISPWLDMTLTGASMKAKASSDVLVGEACWPKRSRPTWATGPTARTRAYPRCSVTLRACPRS